MATYYNAYTLLEHVRTGLNENSTAYLQGTDTTGKYSNAQLMHGINNAYRYLFAFLMRRIPYEFESETDLTAVSSVLTLPWDFGVLRYLKDSNGAQISKIGTDQRKLTNQTGSKYRYYRKGRTIVIDRDGLSDTFTLTYYRKCRELDQGVTSAGGALSATLATTSKAIADYYNGMTIENITDSTVDTISDYTAARVATVANTWAASKYYGIVPEIPEEFHFLIIPRAIFEITGNYPVVQEKPTKTGMELWLDDLDLTLKAFAGPDLDAYAENTWYSTGPSENFGTLIPGHE